MSVQCIDCDRFNLRESNSARLGFGVCALKTRAEMCSATYTRQCEHFKPTDAEKAAGRREWLAKRGDNHKAT